MVQTEFRASHGLRLADGSREDIHSHLWQVQAAVQCPHLNQIQMGIDFQELKTLLNEIAASLEGGLLEEHKMFASVNPTAETVARFFYDRLAPKLPAPGKLAWVEVTEAPGCSVRYAQD